MTVRIEDVRPGDRIFVRYVAEDVKVVSAEHGDSGTVLALSSGQCIAFAVRDVISVTYLTAR